MVWCAGRARWLNWRLDVFSLLVLLLAVLPFYHCYRSLATTGLAHVLLINGFFVAANPLTVAYARAARK